MPRRRFIGHSGDNAEMVRSGYGGSNSRHPRSSGVRWTGGCLMAWQDVARGGWGRLRKWPWWGQGIAAIVALSIVTAPFTGGGSDGDKPSARVAAASALGTVSKLKAEEPAPTTVAPATTAAPTTTTTAAPTTTVPPTTAPPTTAPPTTVAAAPQPVPVAATPAPAPVAAAPATVYFRNCDAARAAGAAPVRRGDPGYASHLDRDNDGVGCE
jgi:hypothetical protein